MDTCNGWTNYATWRINLELFDGMDLEEQVKESFENNDFDKNSVRQEIADYCQQYAEEILQNEGSGLALDYAMAFISDVNWREIADHFVDSVTIYSAGWNMPGFMPDSEPMFFFDSSDAMDYIKEQAESCLEENQDLLDEQADELTDQIESWESSQNGEFGQTLGKYHYFVSII